MVFFFLTSIGQPLFEKEGTLASLWNQNNNFGAQNSVTYHDFDGDNFKDFVYIINQQEVIYNYQNYPFSRYLAVTKNVGQTNVNNLHPDTYVQLQIDDRESSWEYLFQDINQDGQTDIGIISHGLTSANLHWYVRNGDDFEFHANFDLNVNNATYYLTLIDINNDGIEEFHFLNEGNLYVFEVTSDGSPNIIYEQSVASSALVHDFYDDDIKELIYYRRGITSLIQYQVSFDDDLNVVSESTAALDSLLSNKLIFSNGAIVAGNFVGGANSNDDIMIFSADSTYTIIDQDNILNQTFDSLHIDSIFFPQPFSNLRTNLLVRDFDQNGYDDVLYMYYDILNFQESFMYQNLIRFDDDVLETTTKNISDLASWLPLVSFSYSGIMGDIFLEQINPNSPPQLFLDVNGVGQMSAPLSNDINFSNNFHQLRMSSYNNIMPLPEYETLDGYPSFYSTGKQSGVFGFFNAGISVANKYNFKPDETGNFSSTNLIGANHIADFNNDGFSDGIGIVLDGIGIVPSVYLNNGNHNFTIQPLNFIDFNAYDIADMDNDGAIDIIKYDLTSDENNYLVQYLLISVYLNDGSGNFSETNVYNFPPAAFSLGDPANFELYYYNVELADVDANSFQDVIFQFTPLDTAQTTMTQQNIVFVNNNNVSLNASATLSQTFDSQLGNANIYETAKSFHPVDMNNDGILEYLVFSNLQIPDGYNYASIADFLTIFINDAATDTYNPLQVALFPYENGKSNIRERRLGDEDFVVDDFDQNGFQDILVHQGKDVILRIAYDENIQNYFADTILVDENITDFELIDLDKDGWKDVAYTHDVEIYDTIISELLWAKNNGGIISSVGSTFSKINFEVYPNPTTDFIQLQLNDQSIKDFSVELLDALGRTILTKKMYST